MTGVEGYVESASSGLVAGMSAAARAVGEEPAILPRKTMIGALASYVSDPNVTDFQPMNANFGLMPPIRVKGGKSKRAEVHSATALAELDEFISSTEDRYLRI